MSGKTNKLNTPPVKPVEKIELTDKNNKGRIVLVILLIIVAMIAFGYGLSNLLSTEQGWREIKANNTEEMNCSSDFVFMYNIGEGELSPTAENKALTNFYSDATVDAYQIFTSDEGFAEYDNIYTMNHKPNTELEVHEALYEAFELMDAYDSRYMYLGPVYAQYDDIFFSTDESELESYDPYTSEEVALYYAEVAKYAADENAIDVKLLGDNKVMLYVSDEYLDYANENGIDRYIDLSWMKNAFVVDYLADAVKAKGYTLGSISSYDGFSRNLDDSDTEYAFNIYDKPEDSLYQVGIGTYKGINSTVYLRDFVMSEQDRQHYYELNNGEVRTLYLDLADGLCKSSANTFISYSKDKSCSEVLMNIMPVYIAESLDKAAVVDLLSKDVYSIYCKESVIYYNDSQLTISDLYNSEAVNYTTSFME